MNRTLFPVAVVLSTSSLMLVDSAIKGAAILLLAALVTLMLRRDSAATRHLAWLVAIAGMLVVPVFSAILPQWRALPAWAVISTEPVAVETPAPAVATPEQPQATVSPNASPVKSEVPTVLGNQPIAEVPVSQPAIVAVEVIPEPTEPRWNRVSALPLLWAIGFSVLVLRLMAARLMLWSNERRGKVIGLSQRPWDGRPEEKSNAPIVTAFQAACQQLGVRQPVRLLIYSERTIPVVWGIIRFRLLLPAAAGEWSAQQLNSVLLHELAHIKRRDTIAQLLAQIACALHWFNPLVWFAAWRLRVERERACDDLVLARGVQASAYAEHLLNVATRLSSSPWTQACGIAMARNSSLEGRLRAVLSEKLNRRGVTRALGVSAMVLSAAIAIPIAMLRAAETVVQVEESPEDTDDKGEPPKEDPPKRDEVKEEDTSKPEPTDHFRAKEAIVQEAPKEYGPRDWAGWFANQVRYRKQKDGTFPSVAFKNLRKWVIDDLSAKPNASGAAEAHAWLEATSADKNWAEDDFKSMVERIGKWKLSVIQRAMGYEEFASRCFPKQGRPATPDKLRGISFGQAAENGLRVAWAFDPAKKEY
ncbi:MAG: M56 family metallopeptidase, partial [Planctomycetes bacterium]|nr:M56 family metallopeptidase [Planctomycetota bacterium]